MALASLPQKHPLHLIFELFKITKMEYGEEMIAVLANLEQAFSIYPIIEFSEHGEDSLEKLLLSKEK